MNKWEKTGDKEYSLDAKYKFVVYHVSAPVSMIGMPSAYKWAVTCEGSFEDAFRTKKEAVAYVEAEVSNM